MWDYRRLPCRSAITPDATTTKTMTIASASKYHALKNSSMADLHGASHCPHFNLSKEESYATNRIGIGDGTRRFLRQKMVWFFFKVVGGPT